MPLHRAYFHEIAQPAKIPALLQKVLDACESADFRNAHPIQRAAKLHHGFMQVFPYTENSGRVARLLANLVLLQAGYRCRCIIHATDRQRYYESLRLPEAILRDLTIEALENALDQAEKFFRETPVPEPQGRPLAGASAGRPRAASRRPTDRRSASLSVSAARARRRSVAAQGAAIV